MGNFGRRLHVGLVALVLVVCTIEARAQSCESQCAGEGGACAPVAPLLPSDATIPPEPPRSNQRQWSVQVTGTHDAYQPESTARSNARADAHAKASAACKSDPASGGWGGAVLESVSYGTASCTPNAKGDEFKCSIPATGRCAGREPNPAHDEWKRERDRILKAQDEHRRREVEHQRCVSQSESSRTSCMQSCKAREHQAASTGPTGAGTTEAGTGTTGGNAGAGGANGPNTQGGARNGDSGPTWEERQAAREERYRRQEQAVMAGTQEVVTMYNSMDKESQDFVGKLLLGLLGAGMLGLEAWGVSKGYGWAKAIAGTTLLAGLTGVTAWQVGSALAKRDPAEGPYTLRTGAENVRFAVGYERASVNYSQDIEGRSSLTGFRANFTMRFAWFGVDIESGVRWGTLHLGGQEFNHLGMPVAMSWRVQPVNWGHLLSPFVAMGYSGYVQKNTPKDETITRPPIEHDESTTHWSVGNTFVLSRWLGRRGHRTGVDHFGFPESSTGHTLYVEPVLSVGGMGTSVIVRVGASLNAYPFRGDADELHAPLGPDEVNAKGQLAAAMLIDDTGAGVGAQFASCVNFKMKPGRHFCLPVATGVYVDGDGDTFGDAHVAGLGYGLFQRNLQITGFATVGARVRGSEPPGGFLDYFEPSITVGSQVSRGPWGGSVQLLPLPKPSMILGAGVAF